MIPQRMKKRKRMTITQALKWAGEMMDKKRAGTLTFEEKEELEEILAPFREIDKENEEYTRRTGYVRCD